MTNYLKTLSLVCFTLSILVGCATFPITKSRGLSRETGRAFLVETQIEEPGYGLYSYLLFGSPPSNDSVRKLYLQAITDYVNIIVDISELEKYIPRQELNITYLPLNLPPPPSPSAEWILDHYNYARARSLLRTLRRELRDGPYIISTLKPLSTFQTTPDKYLFQDMSSVPPHLISSWVKEFINQAAKERHWDEKTTWQLVLNLRDEIGIAAVGFPEVQKALKENIAWLKTF